MKTIRNVLLMFCCAFLSLAPSSSLAQEKTIAQLQAELVSSWLVTIEGDDRTRTLKISGVTQKTVGVFFLEAEYGMSDEGQSRVWAELSQTDQVRKLMLTTQANSSIVATQISDGSFAGTFTNKKGKVKEVRITKLSEYNLPATAQDSAGQVKPLASGDVVTIEWLTASQIGNQPITFLPSNPKPYPYRAKVEENGDRKFFESHREYVLFAYDKFFTPIIWKNESIDEDRRFVRFPRDQELRPGLKWDVPPRKGTGGSCRMDFTISYTAVSEDGPEIIMTINGRETKIKTIRVNYEADIPRTCAGPYRWRKTSEMLFSPELNEIVSAKDINWDAYCPRTCLGDGSGWTITAIKTANKNTK